MEIEKQQFSDERQERERLLQERQAQETQTYDEESARLGFDALAIAEASCESGPDESSVGGSESFGIFCSMTNEFVCPGMLSLAHSNSTSSFTHAAL